MTNDGSRDGQVPKRAGRKPRPQRVRPPRLGSNGEGAELHHLAPASALRITLPATPPPKTPAR